jgi:hypothetical protein
MITGTTWHAMQMTFRKLAREGFVDAEGRIDECAGGWGSMMSIMIINVKTRCGTRSVHTVGTSRR